MHAAFVLLQSVAPHGIAAVQMLIRKSRNFIGILV